MGLVPYRKTVQRVLLPSFHDVKVGSEDGHLHLGREFSPVTSHAGPLILDLVSRTIANKFLLFKNHPIQQTRGHSGERRGWYFQYILESHLKSFLAFPHSYLYLPSSTFGSDGKESARNVGDPGFDPWVGKIPWIRTCPSTPVFLPGESHGQRSLVGCSP